MDRGLGEKHSPCADSTEWLTLWLQTTRLRALSASVSAVKNSHASYNEHDTEDFRKVVTISIMCLEHSGCWTKGQLLNHLVILFLCILMSSVFKKKILTYRIHQSV